MFSSHSLAVPMLLKLLHHQQLYTLKIHSLLKVPSTQKFYVIKQYLLKIDQLKLDLSLMIQGSYDWWVNFSMLKACSLSFLWYTNHHWCSEQIDDEMICEALSVTEYSDHFETWVVLTLGLKFANNSSIYPTVIRALLSLWSRWSEQA